MFPKSKRAVEPITVGIIIVTIIAALFFANNAGLFSVLTPAGTPVELNPNVNKWYYDTAIQSGTWECSQQNTVYFRTTNLNYLSGGIAYSPVSGDTLITYGRTLGACTNHDCRGTGYTSVPGGIMWTDSISSGDLCICPTNKIGLNTLSTRYSSSSSTTVSTSLSPINNSLELSTNSPIKDSGKFTCEAGNVVTKFCVYNGVKVFASTVQDTCNPNLPCQFLLGQNIPGVGTRDIVKCSGDYKPNLQLCSADSKSIHKTNSLGFLTTTLCGFNGYNVCSNNQCVVCKEGTSWCSDSKTPTDCTSGNLVNRTKCPGSNYCSTSSNGPQPADTVATCGSPHPEGYEDCVGNIPSIWHTSTGTYTNKYSFGACRTTCEKSSGLAVCSNDCTSGINYCEGSIGTLYSCNVNQSGNKKVYFNGQALNSQCLSGSCKDANSCASSYSLNWQYCGGTDTKQIKIGVSDVSNPLTGGVILQDLTGATPCIISCVPDNGNPQKASCSKLTQCVGHTGNVCKDSTTVGTCNSNGDGFQSTSPCQTTNSPRGFCNQPSSGPAFCDVRAAECAGTYGCSVSDGKIYACDSNGYFNKTSIFESCNNLGCSLTDNNLPASTNSQCKDECSASGFMCLAGDLFTCISKSVKDIDQVQKVKSTSQKCTMSSCKDNSTCTPLKNIGTYCNGNTLQESVQDINNPLGGNVKLNDLAICSIGCDVVTSNPARAQCKSAHAIGTYCIGGELWKSEGDVNAISTGGTVQSKIVTCDLSCETVSGTSAKCKGEADPGTYCEGTSKLVEIYSDPTAISSGGVKKRTLATCASGCRGTSSQSAECKPIHELGTYCNGKDLMQAVSSTILANGYVSTSKIITCQDSCDTSSTTFASCSARSLGKYCVGSKELWEAVNDSTAISTGGVRYSLIATCDSTCDGVGGSSAKCSKVHEEGTYCNGKDLMQSVTNSMNIVSGGVTISKVNTCSVDCEEVVTNKSANCISQCDGLTECSGNQIRSCNNNVIGDVIYECASNAANPSSCIEGSNDEASCKDLCSLDTPFKCIASSSYSCNKNQTTNQNILKLYQACGSEGCDSTGKCKNSGIPGSFICIDESLHQIDLSGFRVDPPKFICDNEQPRNGLQPKCSWKNDNEAYDKCTVCSLNSYICTNTQLYQCGDIFEGTPVNVKNCEVGCLNEGGNYYCDQFSSIISTTQNFLLDEDLDVVGIIKRSKSGKGLSLTNIKGTLTISNSSDQIILSSSSDSGNFGINFGKASKFGLGNYQVKIEIPDYNKIFTINVKVTNDFKIGVSGDPILVLVPGTTPSITLDIKGGTGIPDSIVGSENPEGITSYEVKKNEALGKWQLFVEGEPGIYTLNLSAVQSGVRLAGQEISIEIRKPQLTITTGIPSTMKPTKSNYDIKVSGPTGASTTQGITPDLISVTLNGANVDLGSSTLGAGTYSPQFDFSEIGTYNLEVVASKVGYEDTTFSKSIQVSTSGTVNSPGSNETSNNNTNTGTGTSEVNWTWVLIIGIVAFVFWKIKK
jgi:hypothetical protein